MIENILCFLYLSLSLYPVLLFPLSGYVTDSFLCISFYVGLRHKNCIKSLKVKEIFLYLFFTSPVHSFWLSSFHSRSHLKRLEYHSACWWSSRNVSRHLQEHFSRKCIVSFPFSVIFLFLPREGFSKCKSIALQLFLNNRLLYVKRIGKGERERERKNGRFAVSFLTISALVCCFFFFILSFLFFYPFSLIIQFRVFSCFFDDVVCRRFQRLFFIFFWLGDKCTQH